jgi:hypothetical protein
MKRNTLRDKKKKKAITFAVLSGTGNSEKRSILGILLKKKMASFLEGYGSILNISGIDQTPDPYFACSDGERMRGDWESIGNDFRVAMVNYEKIK